MNLNEMIQVVVVGLCSGVGSSLGNYFINKAFIRQIEKIKIITEDEKHGTETRPS